MLSEQDYKFIRSLLSEQYSARENKKDSFKRWYQNNRKRILQQTYGMPYDY